MNKNARIIFLILVIFSAVAAGFVSYYKLLNTHFKSVDKDQSSNMPVQQASTQVSIPQLKSVTKNLIAYEGIIKESGYPELKGKSPMAQGDGPQWAAGMPPTPMFTVYGSSHVGLFGGTIQKTTLDQILQIDCNKTDMYMSHKAFPTYLFYNPYSEAKRIEIDLGDQFTDVYDRISHAFLFKHRKGKISVQIPEDAVRLLVYITGNKKISKSNGMLMKGDRVVDFLQ